MVSSLVSQREGLLLCLPLTEGVPALRGVTVDIKRGEFIVILGKSGGGKTTMLNIMGTIDRPTRGDVYLCGHRVHSKTKDQDLANVRLHRLGKTCVPSISGYSMRSTCPVVHGAFLFFLRLCVSNL